MGILGGDSGIRLMKLNVDEMRRQWRCLARHVALSVHSESYAVSRVHPTLHHRHGMILNNPSTSRAALLVPVFLDAPARAWAR